MTRAIPVASLINRHIGDFALRSLIGQGGFAAVFRAEQLSLGREAAVKVMLDVEDRPDGVTRFLREVRLASSLDHPFAAHIYAFGQEPDGLLWLAMELVRGITLETLIKQQPISLSRFVPLFERLCDVVHCAHESGVVHRDLKPANVMIVSRAGRLLPKLLDLGIAKQGALIEAPNDLTYAAQPARGPSPLPRPEMPSAIDSKSAEATPTGVLPRVLVTESAVSVTPSDLSIQGLLSAVSSDVTKSGIVGSPKYMAPEQWLSASTVDGKADIYSLGILAYRALTGRHAVTGETSFQVMHAHLHQKVPSLGPEFPKALDLVLGKAMAKKPSERYPTALEFAAAFREAAQVNDESTELNQIDEFLRDTFLHSAPPPIAHAISQLETARNEQQVVARGFQLLETIAHWLGVVALACHTRVATTAHSAVLQALISKLQSQQLSGAEWLRLASEWAQPLRGQLALAPVPELVEFMVAEDEATMGEAAADALSLLELPDRERSQLSANNLLRTIQRVLSRVRFVIDYALALRTDEFHELLSGSKGISRRPASSTQPITLEQGHVCLLNADGALAVDLWPFVQRLAPTPGAQEEVFVLSGMGRNGSSRMVAYPNRFERSDEDIWPWMREHGFWFSSSASGSALSTPAPYFGLASFTAADSDNFFGREREAEAFANRIRVTGLTGVVGPSGAGKSSFVQAGVVPLLGEKAFVINVRPGPTPLDTLKARLAAAGITLGPTVLETPGALSAALSEWGVKAGRNVVLIIDQFEELITLCHDKVERETFARVISEVGTFDDERVRVVATMRDDFLIRLQALPGLRDKLSAGLQLLSTPVREELMRILTEPARRAGFGFEPGLTEKMVQAVETQPGALAMLSFAASKLWELRENHPKLMTHRAYETLGGVGGALAHHAESVMATMTADEQKTVREAFRHLVTAEGTRAVLSKDELTQVLGDTSAASVVLGRLVDARLLVSWEGPDGHDRVEVIHEALLASWPTLVRWQKSDAETARLRDQIRVSARQWVDRSQVKALLWRDEVLAEYRVWRNRYTGRLTDIEEAFIRASLRAEVRRLWQHRAIGIGAILLMVALFGAVRFKAALDLKRLVAEEVRLADIEMRDAYDLKGKRDALLETAFTHFGVGEVSQGEEAWAQAQLLTTRLNGVFGRAGRLFETAMRLEPTAAAPRAGLVSLLSSRAEEAERTHQLDLRDEFVNRLALYDPEGATTRRWRAPGRLTLESQPSGARVVLLRDGQEHELGVTPLVDLELAEGNAALSLTLPTRAEVRFPLWVKHGQTIPLTIKLPRAEMLSNKFAYVPEGPFFAGTVLPDLVRALLNARPLRPAHTDAFLIARFETTYAEWLTYLDSLPPSQLQKHLESHSNLSAGQAALKKLPGGHWQLTFSASQSVYTVDDRHPMVYVGRTSRAKQNWLRFPVVGVSFEQAQAYAAWLASTGQVPGARLCNDFEWERAARGADDRHYPHGNVFRSDDANVDETYGKEATAYGPDEVGSHPASASPFGVEDMMGNGFEWVVGAEGDGPSVERGGGFFFGPMVGNVANRNPLPTTYRDNTTGVRLCATPDPALFP